VLVNGDVPSSLSTALTAQQVVENSKSADWQIAVMESCRSATRDSHSSASAKLA